MTRFQVAEPPKLPTVVTLRQQDGLADRSTSSTDDGRSGRPAADADPADAGDRGRPVDASAASIGAAVGDTLAANVDGTDPMLRTVFPKPVAPIRIAVVGTFSVRDSAAPAWFGDTSLAEATMAGTDDHPIAYATAFFAPEVPRLLSSCGLPFRYDVRRFQARRGRRRRPTRSAPVRVDLRHDRHGPARHAGPAHRPARDPRSLRGGACLVGVGPVGRRPRPVAVASPRSA